MLDGESGSGDKCSVASSSEGGSGVVRTMMLRACRAAVRVCCSLRREDVVCARCCEIVARVADRVSILVTRVRNARLVGSRVWPRVLASRASRSLSRARRARADR